MTQTTPPGATPDVDPDLPRVGVLRSTPALRVAASREELAGTRVADSFDALVGALADLAGDPTTWAMLSPAQGRALVSGLYAAEQRLGGILDAGLAAAEQQGWTEETGLGTGAWLHDQHGQLRKVCGARVRRAVRLGEQPQVAAAVADGAMSPDQAAAVVNVLKDLPDELGVAERDKAAETLIGCAAEHDPKSLSQLSLHLLEVAAPDRADELEAKRLQAQEARAARERELHFIDDLHGSVRIRGKLPVAEAAGLRAAIDALANARRCVTLEAAAPGQTEHPRLPEWAEVDEPTAGASAVGWSMPDGSQWQLDDEAQAWLDAAGGVDAGAGPSTLMARFRADALVELAQMAAAGGDLPAHGGDRPRVLVTISAADLRAQHSGAGRGTVGGVGQLADGSPVSWARARQIACDAEVLPVVLDGPGVPLDVGRSERFFKGAVRIAVLARDQGCVFPDCDRPPAACDVHHIIPWWNNGSTCLGNGVALCPHHHGLIEPRPGSEDRQWQIRLGADGLPEVIPPVTVDPNRRARVHARFRIRRIRVKDNAESDPDGEDSS